SVLNRRHVPIAKPAFGLSLRVSHENEAPPVRRPDRITGIPELFMNSCRPATGRRDHPYARAARIERIAGPVRDPLSVGRESRGAPALDKELRRAAGDRHDINAAAVPFGAENYACGIRGDGRLTILVRTLRQA